MAILTALSFMFTVGFLFKMLNDMKPEAPLPYASILGFFASLLSFLFALSLPGPALGIFY
jgi:hypothetical protein